MGDFPGFRNKLPFLGYLAASACTYAISHIIALKIAPTRPKNTDVFADADLIFSLPMYSLLSFLAIQGTRDHWDKGYEAHWYANEGSARHFVMLYAAMNLVHIPITILKRQSKSYKICMTFHHVLSITCMLSGLLNDRLYFFAAFDGVCEVSTLALTTLFILKDGLVGKGSVVNTLITINGVVLWLTYFVFRICLFPTWLYFFLTECYYHKEQTCDKISPFEVVMYPCANIFLLFLSSMWMIQITQGMLKQIRRRKNATTAKYSVDAVSKQD